MTVSRNPGTPGREYEGRRYEVQYETLDGTFRTAALAYRNPVVFVPCCDMRKPNLRLFRPNLGALPCLHALSRF